MEVITTGQTLEGVFKKPETPGLANLYANNWFDFIRYLSRRNRGYFQRRFLNLINEIVEFSCIALVLNVSLMKALVLVPLAHVLINYLSEYHWQLYRALPQKWLIRRFTPIDFGLWILSGILMFVVAWWMFIAHKTDWVVQCLVPIRFIAVILQLGLSPTIARFTSIRRVRPNIPLIWGGAIATWILCLTPVPWSHGITYAFWVTVLFNSNKIIQEVAFYRRVKQEKHRQRLTLPKVANRAVHPFHFHWMLTLVTLHLSLIGLWCYHFRLENSRLNIVIVFFVVALLDRVNGRLVRSLALDFDTLRKLRLTKLRDGFIKRALFLSSLVLLCTETFFLRHRNFSTPVVYGMTYVAIQGLINQVWIYASIGSSHRERHPASKVLVFHVLALGSLLIHGKPGLYSFYVFSALNLITSILWIFRHPKPKNPTDGLWIKYEWDPVIPNRREFRDWMINNDIHGFSLDRKSRVIWVPRYKNWLTIVERFPINIRNWKKILAFPEQAPVEIPEGACPVACNLWGFWRAVDVNRKISEEEGKHLHFALRDWKEYPFYTGSKRSWKETRADGTVMFAGPRNLTGDEMWLK